MKFRRTFQIKLRFFITLTAVLRPIYFFAQADAEVDRFLLEGHNFADFAKVRIFKEIIITMLRVICSHCYLKNLCTFTISC